jgi:tripartite-type tricarboxylate transporter receptor subunit TctC
MSRPHRMASLAWFAALLLAASVLPASPQTFPERTVRIIAPFAAGGSSDVILRKLAEILRVNWGQPVVIENRPGGGNIIAVQATINAMPDGYTLLLLPDPAIALYPLMYKHLRYDPDKDLAPVTTLFTVPMGIAVNASVGVTSLEELAMASRSRELNYASFGVGTAPFLVMELYKKASDARILHIPYNGIAPVMQAMASGDVQITVVGAGVAAPQVETHKWVLLAADRRLSLLPSVPTFAEAGYPTVHAPFWFGIFAPSGTPKPIVDKISADIGKALDRPEFRAYLEVNGYGVGGDRPEELFRRVIDSRALWVPIIKEQGIQLD